MPASLQLLGVEDAGLERRSRQRHVAEAADAGRWVARPLTVTGASCVDAGVCAPGGGRCQQCGGREARMRAAGVGGDE